MKHKKYTYGNKESRQKFLIEKWYYSKISHKWSSRGMGSSRILDAKGDLITRAGGCGYDRYGAALGNAITEIFPEEVLKLAKQKCKGRNRRRKCSDDFYGLFYNAIENTAYLDGGCGSSCMERILNKIGFKLTLAGNVNQSNSGQSFYVLEVN